MSLDGARGSAARLGLHGLLHLGGRLVFCAVRVALLWGGIWGLDGGHLGEVQKGVKLPPKLGGARGLLGLSELWEAGYYIVDVAIGL